MIQANLELPLRLSIQQVMTHDDYQVMRCLEDCLLLMNGPYQSSTAWRTQVLQTAMIFAHIDAFLTKCVVVLQTAQLGV